MPTFHPDFGGNYQEPQTLGHSHPGSPNGSSNLFVGIAIFVDQGPIALTLLKSAEILSLQILDQGNEGEDFFDSPVGLGLKRGA